MSTTTREFAPGHMARRTSIVLALAFTAVLTHGIVYSSIHLLNSSVMLPSTYQGGFAKLCIATWGAWAHVYGFTPMSRMNDFGRFYYRFLTLACPLLGFGMFWLGSRHKIGGQLWKPLAIAIVFIPLGGLFSGGFTVIGLSRPAAEAARAVVVLLLMIWSVGAIQISRWGQKAIEGPEITGMHSSIASS
jgi:hypothetical protein